MKSISCSKIMKYFKGLWLKSDPNLPGAKQKTPLNINRFYLLIIIVIYTATSACIYFDWSAIRNLLLNVGKYKHLNVGEYNDITLTPQYKKINNLYPITLAIHFTMSVFCGFLYDHIGPKYTAMIGQLFNIICWIFLSIDSTIVDTTFIGFIFLGLGADTAFIPVLTVSNLYPDASTFILTVVGAAASLSYAVPATLNIIFSKYPNFSFTAICYGYILLILVPCLLIAIFLLPLKPFKGLDYYLEKDNEKVKSCEDDNGKLSKSLMEDDVEMQRISGKGGRGGDSSAIGSSAGSGGSGGGRKQSRTSKKTRQEKREASNTLSAHAAGIKSEVTKSTVNDDTIVNDKRTDSSKSIIESEDFHKRSIMLFFNILVSYPGICIIIYFILFNISTVFYGMVTDTYFSYDRSIINVINILMPISCIPCIIFGRFINKYGAAIIIILMNAFSALMHLTALIKHRIAGLVSAFLYMCITSIYTSQIYCFIQNSFPSIVFGKLLGFASLCGGLFSLLCEKLYDNITSKDGASIDPTNVVLLLVISFIIMFLPLSILYVRKYERSIENIEPDKNVVQE
ncbi:novel putative transporter 1 [Plasmodium ovale wallikeri]|uniref:Novel putative transporter 1 n=2 Tax=Plasmodium ovale TaxID=36330 RepID=A0A1A8YII6_PLAOA|nr:novel putative transporter 1 [Plasmodium ovale wallikeri]SBT31344.1 novel putative transporter 1 [Plasmodium ovale wallikeri]SBT75322.1 novel putative transporter 1, putative [Plasmodium ovale]